MNQIFSGYNRLHVESALSVTLKWTMNVLFDGSYKSRPLVSLGGSHKNVSPSTPYPVQAYGCVRADMCTRILGEGQ